MDHDRIDSDATGRWAGASIGRRPPTLSWRIWSLGQRGIALFFCIALLPAFAILYVAVRCTSPGPFLFTQPRRGHRDRPFRIYKIRTMVVNPQRPPALWMSRSDPEITPVGRLLRELKLDELPQLWNVVLGQMQFVGPRPIAMDLDDFLRQHIKGFAIRNSVPPGLTSMAQLAMCDCRNEDDLLMHWRRRFQQEQECIHERTVRYDLRVLAKTLRYLANALLERLRVGRTPGFESSPQSSSGVSGEGEEPRDATANRPANTPLHSATLVLGVPIANANCEQVIAQIARWIDRRERCYVAVCPVYSLVYAVWDQAHRAVLRGAGLATADGVPVVWAQRLLGAASARRVAGPTLMLKLLEQAQRDGWRVAFYGGQPARLQGLVENVRRRCPGLTIVEAISPPFHALSAPEDQHMADRLSAARPDLIFVGLGCPKQERWMAEHTRRIPGVMIGVGAAFDFHSGAVPRAPLLLQRLGLEWAYRLSCEPRRLFWRYATTNPAYIALILRQLAARFLLRRCYQVPLMGEVESHPELQVQVFSAATHESAKPRA